MSRLFDDLMEGAQALEQHYKVKSHYAQKRANESNPQALVRKK